GGSTTGIAANLYNRRFLGIDKEKEFLEISRNRKIEIEDKKIVDLFKNKIKGIKLNNDEYISMVKEDTINYCNELPF
ncbi:MAG: site-specific DNA-methyltransferase, partial [Bacteroidales bacterium]